MPKTFEQGESKNIFEQEVIDAFGQLAAKGARRPEDLDQGDPDVIHANDLMEKWAEANPDISESSLREMLMVRAGFIDPDYLDEVAHDWLAQDLGRAEENGDIVLAGKITLAIEEIEKILQN